MAHVPPGVRLFTELTIDAAQVIYGFDFPAGETSDVLARVAPTADALDDAEDVDAQAYRVTLNDTRTGGIITFLNPMQIQEGTAVTLISGHALRIYRDTPVRRRSTLPVRGYAASATVETIAAYLNRVLEELAARLETHATIHIGTSGVKPYALVGGDPIDFGDLRQGVTDEIRQAVDFNGIAWNAGTRTLTFQANDERSVDVVLPEGVSTTEVNALIKAAVDPLSASVTALENAATANEAANQAAHTALEDSLDDTRTALDHRLDDVEALARDFQRVTYLGTPSAAPARYVEIDYTGAGIRNTWVDIPGAIMPAATASNRIDVRVQDHDNTIDEGYNQSSISTYDSVRGAGVEFNNSGGERADNNVYRIRRLSSTRQMQFRSDTSDTYRLTLRETEPDATPRVRIDGTTITRNADGELMSSGGTGGGAEDHISGTTPAQGLPDPDDYALQDLISHAGAPWTLQAGTVDPHVYHGVVADLTGTTGYGAGWYGDTTFAWRQGPSALRAFFSKDAIGTSPPARLSIRFHQNREYGESGLVRASGSDTTEDYAYVHAPGEPAFEADAGEVGQPFDVSVFAGSDYTTPQRVVENTNRWVVAAGAGARGPAGPAGPPGEAAHSVVGQRFNDQSLGLTLTRTDTDRRATNATELTLAHDNEHFDLDDTDKRSGELHFAIQLKVRPVSDVNMGFVDGKANQTATDRERSYSVTVFVSDLLAADAWANDTAGNRDNGLTLVSQGLHSRATDLGDVNLLVGRDSSTNRLLIYPWYDGSQGGTGADLSMLVRCSFTADAAATGGGAGYTQHTSLDTLPTSGMTPGDLHQVTQGSGATASVTRFVAVSATQLKCVGGVTTDLVNRNVGTPQGGTGGNPLGVTTARQWRRIPVSATGSTAPWMTWDYRFPVMLVSLGGRNNTSGPWNLDSTWYAIDTDAIQGLTAASSGQAQATGTFIEVGRVMGVTNTNAPIWRVVAFGRTASHEILVNLHSTTLQAFPLRIRGACA